MTKSQDETKPQKKYWVLSRPWCNHRACAHLVHKRYWVKHHVADTLSRSTTKILVHFQLHSAHRSDASVFLSFVLSSSSSFFLSCVQLPFICCLNPGWLGVKNKQKVTIIFAWKLCTLCTSQFCLIKKLSFITLFYLLESIIGWFSSCCIIMSLD